METQAQTTEYLPPVSTCFTLVLCGTQKKTTMKIFTALLYDREASWTRLSSLQEDKMVLSFQNHTTAQKSFQRHQEDK